MLLAIDIGNTNITLGVFDGQVLLHELRLKTDPARTPDEYEAVLTTLLEHRLGAGWKISRSIISSVVPAVTPEVLRFVDSRLHCPAITIGPGIKTGVAIRTADPAAVGADRIVNAAAVRALYGSPALVVDFGTATTFDCVNAQGEYEGGAIAPGPAVALDSLVRATAKLPRIELSWPKSLIGKSTVSAMQTGVVCGYLAMVDGLIEMIHAESAVKHVIATGGLGALFSERSKRIQHYRPDLTLQGLRIIDELNR